MEQLSLHSGSKVFHLKTPFIVHMNQFPLGIESHYLIPF